MSQKVIVVGSLSMDLVLTVPRLPLVGETIKGDSFSNFVGGKGNNQALAAAKLGASVSMLGLLGKDNYGDAVLGNLQQNNVDCRHMLRTDKTGTGIANIWVGPAGENVIVIIPNANGALSPQLVEENKAIFDDAAVMLLQLEIPLETVTRAAQLARECGVKVILNPAPAPADGKLPAELLGCVDIIVPNETEALLITGINPDTEEHALRCAEKLLAMGPGTVVLTLGARGALIVEQSGNHQFISSFQVKVVDTTAAGDAFLGAMAAGLADNLTAGQAVKQGCAAGALACTRAGAAPSLPSKEALSTLLENATG
ncbi:MAG: ribokinase [Candidatus Obscuribacter sp.]|nr:ribokinase [Candidatus Obscuribacter sp.]